MKDTAGSVSAPIRKASSMGRDGSTVGTSPMAFWGSHFIAGQAAGMCGYPFAYPGDFIKCRVQNMTAEQAAKVQVIPEMKKVIKTEGWRGLYRGLWSPFFLFGITSSAYFGVNFNLRQYYEARNNGKPLSLGMLAAIGAAAGTAATPIITLTDRVKTWTITQGSTCPEAAKGLYASGKLLVRKFGWRQGLFYGLVPTVIREAPQVAIYYSFYEAFTHRFVQKLGGWDRDTLPSIIPLFTGAAAGGFVWTLTLWLDKVKTVIMAAPPNTYSSYGAALSSLYKKGGVRGLNVGWQACMLRSMPFHGVVWFTYSRVQKGAMEWLDDDE